jgi:hypothetical protein
MHKILTAVFALLRVAGVHGASISPLSGLRKRRMMSCTYIDINTPRHCVGHRSVVFGSDTYMMTKSDSVDFTSST